MNDNRIGTYEALPAVTVSGRRREPACPVTGLGGEFVVARDLFPGANEDAVIEELTASLAPKKRGKSDEPSE